MDVSSHGVPGTDVPSDFAQMLRMAEELAKAELFVPPHLVGKPADLLALMVRARGLDIPLAVAWDELYATGDGDVGRTALLVRGLARRAGHRIDYVEHDRFHAVALMTMADGRQHEIVFTIQDAMEMGYTDPNYPHAEHWIKQPENMLIARVTTRAVRWYCPEVMLGMGVDLDMHSDETQTDTQVVAVREERRAQVVSALRLVPLTERQPNGVVRLNLLRELFMECRGATLLDYAADDSGALSVRHVLTDAIRAADTLAKAQAGGDAEAADPDGGPKTLKDLRGLLEAEEGPAPEAETAPDDAPPAAAPKAAPRAKAKKAAKKTASRPRKSTAAKPKATGSAKPRKTAQAAQGSAHAAPAPAPQQPAARPAGRPSARPDNDRLPCGCLTDHVISTGLHACGGDGR